MRRLLLLLLATASTVQAQPAGSGAADAGTGSEPAAATLLDKLGWNSRERTATGIDALRAGRPDAGRAALDTALRLRPEEPTTQFNAGTARLAQGDPSATSLLERAAQSAGPELAPAAWYNLGTARLASGDLQGAVAALVEALERRPEHAAAKHNLELALREIERQKQKREQEQQRQQQEKQAQRERSDSEPSPQQDTQPDPGQNESAAPQSPTADGTRPEPKPAPGSQPAGTGQKPGALPQFRDLPDMTADQAAAILRAVENLERQQRRDRAARAAAVATTVEIDW